MTANTNANANANATPTIDQGIEAAAQWRFLKSGDHSLSLRASYTYNDFYYRDDPLFGDNQLPRHVLQGETR